MTNTNRSQRPPQAKRRARRSSLGCSLAFVAVLVILAGGVFALGPNLLDRLLGTPTTGAPATVNDPTSPEKLAALRQQESAQLEGYGWVNQASGIARIPINRAIALVAEKGLPVGKPQAQAPAANETAATNAPAPTVDLANVSFTNDVLPIFQQHCLKCHGNDNPEKGLELSTYKTMMLGSEDGSVVTPGDPDKSYLVEMVVTKKMPKKGAPLSATEINTIIAWVKAGAKDDTGAAPKKTTTQATAAVTATTTTTAAAPVDLAHVSFKNNVLPIFQQHCLKCHGNDNPEEGLELTSYRTTMTGSQNGSVVEPGDPDNSYLVKMVVSKKMPKKGPPLSSTEIDTIIAWIKAGAKDDTDSAPAAPAAQSTAPVSATEQSAQTTVTATETPAPTATGIEEQATVSSTATGTASPSAQETTTNTAEATTTPAETVTSEATEGTPTPSETAATETATPLATTETPTATTTISTTSTSSSTDASSTVSTTPVTTTAAVDLTNVSFQKNVLPIFQQHCLKCHGNDNPEEGLELTKYRTLMTGSENGSVVEPSDPDNSYLVKMIVSKKMPKKGPPLSSTQIETIIAWIKAGAKDN